MLEDVKHGEGLDVYERESDDALKGSAAVASTEHGSAESIAIPVQKLHVPPRLGHEQHSKPRYEREHRIWLNFVQVSGGRPVALDLHRKCNARWGHCVDPDLFAGFSINTDPNVGTMSLLFFKMNQHQVQFSCGDDTGVLTVRLFVATNESLIYGVSMLPAGSTLTLESVCDSVTIVGEGSWYLRVAP